MESKSKLINVSRQKDMLTENLMVTNSTSLNNNVDFFFLAGASRRMSESNIITLFQHALVENPLIALKVLFWARDVRGGAGERRLFRICVKFLNDNYPQYINQNIKLIPEYGRWDDMFHLSEDVILPLIKTGLENKDGLLAKWLDRKGNFANSVRKYLGITPKEYRKTLVRLSDTVEQKMCSKEWEHINYSHVPSSAMNKYRKAFERNDKNRFIEYINLVTTGDEKINAGTLFPHQLYDAYCRGENKEAVEAQWNSLKNYMEGSTEKILPVCDVSGSMTGLPMSVSVSLGVYISERNESIFKDSFITFSSIPEIIYLRGSLYERFRQLKRSKWSMNTNLEAVYELILNKATENNLSEEDMPTKILIISDMEFDQGVRNSSDTALEMIQKLYVKHGYTFPEIIFWNLNGRIGNIPANFKSKNVGLISGFSPSILKSVLNGKVETPEKLMLKTILSERYDDVKIS